MKYEMNEKRFVAVKQYLDYVIEHPDDAPDKGIILAMSDEEVSKAFTKRRIELINVLKKGGKKTVSELSEKLDRKLSAVERDLKILENLGIVDMEKKGRSVMPRLRGEVLIIPLVLPKRLEGMVA
ncbi:MAG: ArsR family transcriptional regulator [Candidatus Altiarchaeota archaeon]|nr:ArsR family transcriptional regulator [Candidatus Altiarchaeota archaeon]